MTTMSMVKWSLAVLWVVRLPNIIVTEPRRISAVSGLIMAYLMLQCCSALDVAGIEISESSAQLM